MTTTQAGGPGAPTSQPPGIAVTTVASTATVLRARPWWVGERPVWMPRTHPLVSALKLVALVVICVLMIFPFWNVIMVSLSRDDALDPGEIVLWPREFTLGAYEQILAGTTVYRAFAVSVGVTVIGTVVSVFFTVITAYGLSRTKETPGARTALMVIIFTMLFGAGLIPNFLLVKQLGLLDSYASLIVPGLISAFNLVVMRNFFMEIPDELIESARVDGANDLDILIRIVMPLSKAVIAVIALFYAVGYWNSFFNALIYLNDTAKWPLQVILNQFVVQGQPLPGQDASTDPNLMKSLSPRTYRTAIIVLATVPVLLVYPFLQKYFTKGILTGAIKG